MDEQLSMEELQNIVEYTCGVNSGRSEITYNDFMKLMTEEVVDESQFDEVFKNY